MTYLHQKVLENPSWLSLFSEDWFDFTFCGNEKVVEVQIPVNLKNSESELYFLLSDVFGLPNQISSLQQFCEVVDDFAPFPDAEFVILKVEFQNISVDVDFLRAFNIFSTLINVAYKKNLGDKVWKVIGKIS